MENETPIYELSREEKLERINQLESNYWDDWLDGAGDWIKGQNAPSYGLFIFKLRCSFKDEEIPYGQYCKGYSTGSRQFEEQDSISKIRGEKWEFEDLVNKAKKIILASTPFPIQFVSDLEGSTHYRLDDFEFLNYGYKIREEYLAWQFVKENKIEFEDFLNERKKGQIPKIDFKKIAGDVIEKKKYQLSVSYQRWLDRALLRNDITLDLRQFDPQKGYVEREFTDLALKEYEEMVRKSFLAVYSNNKTIGKINLALRAFEKTGIFRFNDEVISPANQSRNNIQRGVDFFKDILADMENIVNGETKPNLLKEPNLASQDGIKKIKWKGSPAQFGFIIQQLIEKGFVEKPTSSYEKDASRYLQVFDIETTQGTLAKELSQTSYSLTKENEKKFKIPRIEELK